MTEPDVTDTALPTGAEVFAQICDVVDVTRTGSTTFVGRSLPHVNGRIYGGQVFAQAVVAASRTVPADRFAHSVHGYFLRPGNLDLPIELAVEELHDGRSFSARRTHALQDGVPILSLIASFQEDQPGLEHRQDPPPDVPGPEDLVSSDALFRDPAAPHITRAYLAPKTAFDIRHVDAALYLRPAPETSSTQALWIRAHGALPAGTDRNVRAALLAYACDQVMLEAVMRAHELSWTTPGLSVASIDHAMWWHHDVDLTQWLLFVQSSPAAQGGRGLGAARVYDRSGTLVASIAQEGVVRVRERSAAPGPAGP